MTGSTLKLRSRSVTLITSRPAFSVSFESMRSVARIKKTICQCRKYVQADVNWFDN